MGASQVSASGDGRSLEDARRRVRARDAAVVFGMSSKMEAPLWIGLSLALLAACGNVAPDPATKDAATYAPDPAAPASAAASVAAASDGAPAPTAPSAATDVAPAPASSPAGPAPRAAIPHGAAPPEPIARPSSAPTAAPSAQAVAPTGPVAGKPWALVASAVADAGYHCNSDYPNKFTTTGGTNVTYPSSKVPGACAGKGVSVTIPIVPTAAGPGTVVGTLSYGICDEAKTSCLMKKKDVTLAFNAAP